LTSRKSFQFSGKGNTDRLRDKKKRIQFLFFSVFFEMTSDEIPPEREKSKSICFCFLFLFFVFVFVFCFELKKKLKAVSIRLFGTQLDNQQ